MPANRYLPQKLRMQHVRLIDALERAGSLSGAARLIGVSQPAASKVLQDAEALVGQRLFDRGPLGVRATPAGGLFIRYAQRLLSDLSRLNEDLDRLESASGGVVALGVLPVAAAGLAWPILRRIAAEHPALELQVEEGRLEALAPRLVSGDLAMVLGRLYEPDLPDGLVREPLYDEPIALVARAGHPAFDRSGGLDLAGYTLLLPTFSQRVGREIEHFLARVDIPLPARRLRSTSHMLIRETVHETDMVTVAPELLLAGDLRRGSLRVLPVGTTAPNRPGGLLLNPARPASPAVELVVGVVRACVAERLAMTDSGVAPPS